jgi:hypothetical protein
MTSAGQPPMPTLSLAPMNSCTTFGVHQMCERTESWGTRQNAP